MVIANPNGITCSGCSFVNTNKAILTTGKVNMTDDGAIGSYTVTGGTLTIGENGMNAANGYAVLLATRSISTVKCRPTTPWSARATSPWITALAR
ncbi:Large exoproteins involved in heme utilization or adhesion [Klebsiella pneumoniae IS46]|nr:Large exoproteins involved in heme utilization or adhesion [Klebsiella pneumoniae IS46]